ncbi:Retrovirus-related Pol polyprotein from transposon TNT 1-94 [Senna tora]|uniref:Retrovirus-related Pol polyprotein from transposon TNT 1-94 n=1 Tax=Senna tora TaxID=362788 RepID=A0A835C2N8_9FABA|nr:Retrovirus-related Pol polyprotein from transposon TNT 1-94 [Senna tora]
MALANYEVENFDGGSSFNLWKIQMQLALTLQDLWQAIKNKFANSVIDESRLAIKKALSAIFMNVTDNVL